MRILSYIPYATWFVHGAWELTILWGLKLRDIQTKIIICDGVYNACDIQDGLINKTLNSCLSCINGTKNILKMLHLENNSEYDSLSKYLLDSDYLIAQNLTKSLNYEEFEDFLYEDFPIGECVKSSIYTTFRINNIDYNNKKIVETYRGYIYSGILAYISLKRILNNYKPDRVLFFNGRMSSLRILFELCQLYNIPVYTHDRGFLANTLQIKWNKYATDISDIQETWQSWENIPLNLNELEKVKNLLLDRSKGRRISWKVHSHTEYRDNWIFDIIKTHSDKKIATLFTSSQDEIASSGITSGIFNSQLEFLENTIDFFSKQKYWILIIKSHPNIGSKTPTENFSQDYQELLYIKNKLSENIFLIMPEEKINSYKLMDLSHICITYGSTVGLEVGALGKPVVNCRKGFYHGVKGFISINDKNEYNDILNKVIQLDYNNKEIKKYSYRFLYHYFFRMCVPFPLITILRGKYGKINYSNIEELKYGNDIYLDKITDTIIENKPIYPLPNSEDYERTEKDEEYFFSSTEFKYIEDQFVDKQKRKILIIETNFKFNSFSYNLWKEITKNNFECLIISIQIIPQYIKNNIYNLNIKYISKNVTENEIIIITKEFQPDIIYCDYNNHNIALMAQSFKKVPLVVFLKTSNHNYKTIKDKLYDNTTLIISDSELERGQVEIDRSTIWKQYYIVISKNEPISKIAYKYIQLFNALLDNNLHEVWSELWYEWIENKENDIFKNKSIIIKKDVKVLFCKNNLNDNTFPFLMAYTTSFLRKNRIKAYMIDLNISKESLDSYFSRIRYGNFEWVIIETSNESIDYDLMIAENINKYSKVALSGYQDKIKNEELITKPFIKAILKGEYEKNSLKLIQTQEYGIYDYDLVEDLDTLPFPYRDYSVYYYGDRCQNNLYIPQLQILGSRKSYISGEYRIRRCNEILKEIKTVFDTFSRFKSICIYDDFFYIDKNRVLEFCDIMKKINMPWKVNCTSFNHSLPV